MGMNGPPTRPAPKPPAASPPPPKFRGVRQEPKVEEAPKGGTDLFGLYVVLKIFGL